MENIIYHVSGIEDWIEVAKEMKSKYDWKPIYWVSPHRLKSKVEAEFPNVIFHDGGKAGRSSPPEDYSNSFQYPLDKQEIEKHIFEQSISIKMMDRMDPGFKNDIFEYDERVRNHFRLLMWWKNVLRDENIDKVVFNLPPHVISDYTLYIACKDMGIETIMFKDAISLPRLIYSQKSIGDKPLSKEKTYSENNSIPAPILDYIEEIKDRDSDSQLSSNQLNKKRVQNYLEQLKPLFRGLILNPLKIGSKDPYKILKKSSKDIEDSEYSYLDNKKNFFKKNLKRLNLHRYYNKISERPSYSENYIYFPLHYQPELTSCPQGGMYVHQFLVANLISSCLPKNWKLLIKEHPYTFFKRSPYGRDKYHYRHLKKLDSVKLVGIESSQMKLIDNSEAVATITGTPGLEAAVMRKPSLIFGNAWYRQCNSVNHIENSEELENILNEIQEGIQIDENHLKSFLSKLSIEGFRGYVDQKGKKESENIIQEENIERLSEELEKYT